MAEIPGSGPWRIDEAFRLDGLETLLRYVQPVPGGYFCRNAVKAAVWKLLIGLPAEEINVVWARWVDQFPPCDFCC